MSQLNGDINEGIAVPEDTLATVAVPGATVPVTNDPTVIAPSLEIKQGSKVVAALESINAKGKEVSALKSIATTYKGKKTINRIQALAIESYFSGFFNDRLSVEEFSEEESKLHADTASVWVSRQIKEVERAFLTGSLTELRTMLANLKESETSMIAMTLEDLLEEAYRIRARHHEVFDALSTKTNTVLVAKESFVNISDAPIALLPELGVQWPGMQASDIINAINGINDCFKETSLAILFEVVLAPCDLKAICADNEMMSTALSKVSQMSLYKVVSVYDDNSVCTIMSTFGPILKDAISYIEDSIKLFEEEFDRIGSDSVNSPWEIRITPEVKAAAFVLDVVPVFDAFNEYADKLLAGLKDVVL